MAARLFCNATIRQLKNAQKQLKQSHRQSIFANTQCASNSRDSIAALGHILNAQLHVKVYDKDAGLDIQREANKRKTKEKLNEEDNVPSSTSHRIRKTPLMDQNLNPFKMSERGTEAKITEKRKDELVLNDDADAFGSSSIADDKEDEGDLIEEEYISNPKKRSKRLSTAEYGRIIKEHLHANRIKDALAVLEQRMLKEDRAKPENYIYNLLISGCAKAGYTRKAFQLFTRMRQRGLKVTGGTYTSLFNACANAPSAADGLGRANNIREIMLEKGYEPNVTNYNAMIKAYGRCGDVKTAYLLADEMMERQLEVNTDTFNFLLQACASDSHFGFRHCLLTWHKMLQCGIHPDYYSFNTVLRCVRDCQFGDLQTMQQVLKQILAERQSMHIQQDGKEMLLLDQEPTFSKSEISKESENTTLESSRNAFKDKSLSLSHNAALLEIPNLLATRPHLGSLVSLSEVTKPHERFLLLGGINGFLDLMKQNQITPDIEAFTTMLEVIPPTNAAEKQLLSFIRKIGLKADIDFFNVLIKKRSMRFDYEGAKEVLSMIRTAGLNPDIVTYGVLALGCQTEEAARELLTQMRNNGVRMNIQILGAMLRQGCAQKTFPYVMEIMQISLDEHIKPNDIFLRHLHNFYNQCARAIDARHPYTKGVNFKKGHAKFCEKLRLYHEEQGVAGLKLDDAIKKIQERPYDQYKEAALDGMETLKNEKLTKKQKLRKYIKKIKIDNLRDDDIIDESSKPKTIQ